MNQMDNNFLYFLRMAVPIAATLIGLAFLGPLIQAASSELFRGRERYFKALVIYKRILSHKFFALSIFAWPFLSSLSLLINQSSKMEISVKAVSIILALVILLWYRRLIMPTILHPGRAESITECFWLIGPLLYVCYGGATFFHSSFDLFFKITVTVFMFFGLVSLIDSLLTPIEVAIFFKRSEIDQKYKDSVEKCFDDIRSALADRGRQVKRLKSLPWPPHERARWHRDIAKYHSEMRFLSKQFKHLEEPKGLKQEWEEIWKEWKDGEKITKSKDECVYVHVSAFDERKEKVLTEYLLEFERVTKEIELLVERLGEERESDK